METIKEAKTNNPDFERNGYLVIKNLYDAEKLYTPMIKDTGVYNWRKNLESPFKIETEEQVPGSLSRYWCPQYRQAHFDIKNKIEHIIGKKLYETYYFDRFYYAGHELVKHRDRDSCEISVTVHVSTNLPESYANWPICITTPYGEDHCAALNPGDGMIYKGCEMEHWRDPMKTPRRMFFKKGDYYYHQVFFHYVLQDGWRAHAAWDPEYR